MLNINIKVLLIPLNKPFSNDVTHEPLLETALKSPFNKAEMSVREPILAVQPVVCPATDPTARPIKHNSIAYFILQSNLLSKLFYIIKE